MKDELSHLLTPKRSWFRKQKAAEYAESRHDWDAYLGSVRPIFEIPALLYLSGRLDDLTYWRLLREVWPEAKGVHRWRALVPRLFDNDRSRDGLMNEPERGCLRRLPPRPTIYRGYSGRQRSGWSWTLSEAGGLWFARRSQMLHGSPARVAVGAVARRDIIAFFAMRGEDEIVVDPHHVRIIRSYAVETRAPA